MRFVPQRILWLLPVGKVGAAPDQNTRFPSGELLRVFSASPEARCRLSAELRSGILQAPWPTMRRSRRRGSPSLFQAFVAGAADLISLEHLMFDRLKEWWTSRSPKPAKEMLSVEFDEEEIRIRVLDRLGPEWNQSLRWSNIKRVCYKDGGMLSSDLIYISQIESNTVIVVPTEAQGGHAFFGALCDRQLFPEAVWRRAVGDTGGGLHCWPSD